MASVHALLQAAVPAGRVRTRAHCRHLVAGSTPCGEGLISLRSIVVARRSFGRFQCAVHAQVQGSCKQQTLPQALSIPLRYLLHQLSPRSILLTLIWRCLRLQQAKPIKQLLHSSEVQQPQLN